MKLIVEGADNKLLKLKKLAMGFGCRVTVEGLHVETSLDFQDDLPNGEQLSEPAEEVSQEEVKAPKKKGRKSKS